MKDVAGISLFLTAFVFVIAHEPQPKIFFLVFFLRKNFFFFRFLLLLPDVLIDRRKVDLIDRDDGDLMRDPGRALNRDGGSPVYL